MNVKNFINNYTFVYTEYHNASKELDSAINKVGSTFEDIDTIVTLKDNINKYGLTQQMSDYLHRELCLDIQLSKQELSLAIENLLGSTYDQLVSFINWLIGKVRSFLRWILDWFNLSNEKTKVNRNAIAKDDPKKDISKKEIPGGLYNKTDMIKINGDITHFLQKLSVDKIRRISLASVDLQSQVNTSTKFDELVEITNDIVKFTKTDIKTYKLHKTFKSAGINLVKDLQDPVYNRILNINADNDHEIIVRMKLLEEVMNQYETWTKTKSSQDLPVLTNADVYEYAKDPAAYEKIILNRLKIIHKILGALRMLQATNSIISTQYNKLRKNYNKKES